MREISLRFCLALVAVFTMLTGTAQDGRYIEVVVSDTIAIMPTQYVYEITLGGSKSYLNLYDDDDNGDDKHNKEAPATYEALVRMLKRDNFKVKDNEIDFSISSKTSDKKTIQVVLDSKIEVERLYNSLKDEKGITGKVSAMLGDEKLYTDKLYKKLYTQAKEQATALAQISNSQVGVLLNASEVAEETNSFMNLLMEVWKKMPQELLGGQPSYILTYEKKFRFRFELK